MMPQLVSTVLLVICLAASCVFVLLYALLAPWYRSTTGRHMMATTVALAVIFAYLALARFGVLHDLGPDARMWTVDFAYGLMAVVLVWRVSILVQLQLRARLRRKKQGDRDETPHH